MLISAPAHADPLARWQLIITEASLRFGIPERWIVRVIRAESGGQTMLNGKPIASRAGAMGLMQLMPATWAAMRGALGLGTDPHDPHDNIVAGTAYLRAMYDRFGYPGLFAAYNAGPGRYADHVSTGRALPDETQAYLATVAWGGSDVVTVSPRRVISRANTLFAVRRMLAIDTPPPATVVSHGDDRARMFVTLTPH